MADTRRDKRQLPTLSEIAEAYHEHPDLPPGRLPNGLWKCIGCGRLVGRSGRWLNWCSDCGYDEWDLWDL